MGLKSNVSLASHKDWFHQNLIHASQCQKNFPIVGEPKSRIFQNDKKIAPDFDMAEFLYIGSLNSA